ncbi:MAG: acyl-CoA dehydrogenase family protein [Bacillus sp. (in: firmicutes)]
MLQLFTKTELQRNWLQKLNELESFFTEKAAENDQLSRFPIENIEKLVDIGYTSLSLPTEYGGGGINVYDLVMFQETLARFDGATALSIGWHMSQLAEIYDKKLWNEQQLQTFSTEVIDGKLMNKCASERLTGSPTRGGRPGTNAVKEGDLWVITGRKAYTTMSPALSYFVVTAWIEEKQATGFFLLHRDLPGLSIDETWNVISMRGTGSHDLVLDEVKVDDSKLVELIPPGKIPEPNGWMLHIPAVYLGIAQAARDYAVHFANQHSPNSIKGPISSLPNVRQLIGEIDLKLMEARHFLYSIAEAYSDESRKHLVNNEIGAAKHIVTNAAITIVDKSMRIAGAQSLQLDNPLQRYYRDVRAGLHNPPMDDATIQKLAQAAIEADTAKK